MSSVGLWTRCLSCPRSLYLPGHVLQARLDPVLLSSSFFALMTTDWKVDPRLKYHHLHHQLQLLQLNLPLLLHVDQQWGSRRQTSAIINELDNTDNIVHTLTKMVLCAIYPWLPAVIADQLWKYLCILSCVNFSNEVSTPLSSGRILVRILNIKCRLDYTNDN